MALYEYRCEDCESTFTLSELISEHEKHAKTPACPECGSVRTLRVLSGFFAKTDYKT